MDNNDFKLNETGINPVDTASENNDIYFTNVNSENYEQNNTEVSKRKAKSTAQTVVKKAPVRKSKGVASTYIFFIIVIAVSMVLSIYAILCINDVLGITKTTSTVTVNLDKAVDNVDDAVDILADNGLIKCKNFCKFFANYRKAQVGPHVKNGYISKTYTYDAGIYYLNGKMGLEGMLVAFQGNNSTAETVTITFPEGYTVPEIVQKLADNEVCDKSALLSVIQTVDFSYSLVSDLKAKDEVPYRLEGYLFPDTYDFYIGETANSVIKKFLSNGDTKIKEKYRKRAEQLGYSMDDIIKIASIIQCEAGNTDQMKTISAVIHNRLNDKANFPLLGVDSTGDYITNKVAPALSSTTSHTADYYKQYYSTTGSSTVVGLPPSPICNPGIDAIEAALYPENVDYYYFFHDTKGNMYTAKTYSEFKQKAATYAPYLNVN
ncbi:MAG: endolytic transglycosylase MltG [Eubacteriales bacterium]|nr:endolytic transglycosylase MltG [Eubacteriales bacterium]